MQQIPSSQDWPILPTQVTNQNIAFASARFLTHSAIILSYSQRVRNRHLARLALFKECQSAKHNNFIKCVNLIMQVLIPVFALGRAQELCILLETYWYDDTVCSIQFSLFDYHCRHV